jgi:molecular chaperone DnaK
MKKVLGIDLGTTNSVVAVMEGGRPVVIPNAEGFRTTPSVVAYTKNGDKLVGQIAKRQTVINPDNTFYSVKRFIGRTSKEVSDELKQVSYVVHTNSEGAIQLKCPALKTDFAPEAISSEVLRKLAEDASNYLGEKVKHVVITVPAYFNNPQREATNRSGFIAGLEVLRIINEPTAAALAYGLEKKEHETILVFDLGGGTFDVSVMVVGEGIFEVLSTSGDTHLGGDDFDDKIVKWLLEEFKSESGIDLRSDRQALQRLTEASEKAKVELSNLTQTEINLPFITATSTGPKHLERVLTRRKFEELCASLIDRVQGPISRALQDAKLDASNVDEVVLVGGSTRIPAVKSLVKKLLGKEPNQTVNPDEVVAIGAAVQAGVLAGEIKDIVLLDVTPLSLSLETLGGVSTRLIPRNTTVPTKKSEVFSTATDNQSNVEIHVLQGERELAKDNKSLGTFRLEGLLPAPRGVPQIEVTFDIDSNGILSVTAKDKKTGKQQSITIRGASTLSSDEVERMVQESEMNAEADKSKRDKIDTKNRAESTCYQCEKQLGEEFKNVISPSDKEHLSSLLEKLKVSIKEDDYEAMKSLTTQVEESAMGIGKKIYEQRGDATSNSGTNDDVIDITSSETK